MKDFCIVLVFNYNFLDKAKETIKQIRSNGKYFDDIVCIVGDDLKSYEDVINNISNNVRFLYFPDINRNEINSVLEKNMFDDGRVIRKAFQYHKFYCFSNYFKDNYKKCLYVDCGMQIFKPINKIINLDCNCKLLAHSDAYPTYEWKLYVQFDKTKYFELYNEVSKQFNLNVDYFQSTMMLYDTSIILEDTFNDLIKLSEKYINSRNNDQGILNLYFTCIRNVWEQIKLKDNETLYYDFYERFNNKKSDYIMLKYPQH